MAPCGGEAILVAARLRPQLPGDGDQKQCLSVAGGKQVLVGGALESGKHAFTFDHAWGGDVSQAEVFAQAAPLVDSVLQGFNSTVFAHGPSGSGKTHTMIGSPEDPGVVTRALDRIFLLASQHSSRLTCVFISVLELYNNEFFDLLDGTAGSRKKQVPGGFTPQKRKDKIEVVRNGEKSTLKGKFTKLTVESSCVASEAIDKALAARATSGTNLNDRSSRSHAIVSIQVSGGLVFR
ncbi:P-loop containing nucleoside triphosphate hydrolase protein [Baffinella frigidus]|nr:P-loop containing nucleoside triphosphate hydrolase protein [Cryptophyta sp. CCMP2293]